MWHSHMLKNLRSKRAEISMAIKNGHKKPSWCSKSMWEEAKQMKENNKEKQTQQREARKMQLETKGTSRLGSGGAARFKALFVSILVIYVYKKWRHRRIYSFFYASVSILFMFIIVCLFNVYM